MALDINDTANRVRYTATAGQTSFTIPFQFLATDDIKVWKNGEQLVYSTDYTVTGAGASSGSMVLVSAAALSDDILIIRDMPVRRIGDFPVSGPFDVESLNTQLDGLTMMVRDLETRISRRSLHLDTADEPETMGTLPAKAVRAGRVLGFNTSGNPVVGTPLTLDGWEDYQAAAEASATIAVDSAATATTQAGIATAGASTATAQAVTATLAASASAAAKTAAEGARDAAFVNAAVYASTAAGIAATTNGQQFQVVVGDEIVRYQNSSGTAVEVARYPSASKVAPAVGRAVPWVKVITKTNGTVVVPAFQYEKDLGLVWINGRVLTVASALTAHGDGSYTLNEVLAGLSAGATVYFEWTGTGGTASGVYFSMMADTTSLAAEIAATASYDDGGANVLGFTTMNRSPSITQQMKQHKWGANRGVMMVPPNGNTALYGVEDKTLTTGGASANFAAPIAMSIQRAPSPASTRVLANATVPRVIVYPGTFTAADIQTVFEATDPDLVTAPSVFPKWLAVLDLGNGSKIIPSFQFDPKRNRCWYKGKERAISDVLINNVDGTWTMKKAPYGLRDTTGVTVIADVWPTDYYTFAAPISGTLFHCSSATLSPAYINDRLQLELSSTGTTPPGGLFTSQAYASKLSSFFSVRGPVVDILRGQGINRFGISAPVTGKYLLSMNATGIAETSASASSYVAQDYFRFGAIYNGTSKLTNGSLEQVIIYSQSLTSDQLRRVMEFNEYGLPPLWFVGDSINNVEQPAEMLRLHLANRGATYLPMVSGGLGGRGLSYFAEYIPSILSDRDYMRDYILVMVEGGFDYSSLDLAGTTTVGPYSEKDIQGYLRSIFSQFRQPKRVYMESNSNQTAESDIAAGNTVGMTKLRNTMKNIRETYPAAYCATIALMQAQAATSAEYDAIRVDGRIATHLRGDGIHFPWGTAYSGADSGYYWWSLALLNHLQSIGYDAAKPAT